LKKLIFILISVFSFASLVAQNNSSIPEIKALPKNLPRSVYADSLFRIAKKYKDIDALKASAIFEQVIDSAKKINYNKLIIKSNNIIGLIKAEQNQLAKAYEFHQTAFKLASRTNDSAEIAITYNYIGDTYKRLRLQEKGVEYSKRAVKIAQMMKDSSHIASFSDRVGHIFMDWAEEGNHFDYFYEALKNYKYSLHINEKRNDLLRLSLSYVNLANAYIVMYKHGGDKSFLRQSISYSLKGQDYAKEGNHQLEWATNTLNLGEAHFQLGNLDMAMDYYKQSVAVHDKLTNRLWHAAVLVDMALVYEKKKQYDKAIELIEEANKTTMDYDHVAPFENYKYLAELYAEKNDYKAAYTANKKYHELLNRDVNTRTMLEMEGKQLELDIERKDKEIELLNKENNYNAAQHQKDIIINYVLFGFSILMIVVLILMYNRSKLLKRQKELADEARMMQQQFLANTSHEIRTPMNGIIGMANQLERSQLTEEQKGNLQVIKKSADNLLNVINDVLDLSKIQAGKIEFEKKNFLIDVLSDDLLRLFKPQAEQKKIELHFTIDKNMPEVICGDELRLKQVLINLLSNAIKFTERGKVELKIELENQKGTDVFVKFIVSDTGIGIPLKKQQDVFESFVQLESSGKRTRGGTGLGLAISKRLVDLQGGQIKVISGQYKGSVFYFTLPFQKIALEQYIAECEAVKTPVDINKNLRGISVLVVEDNVINQQVIAKILERWEAYFLIASSAVEGFDFMTNNSFDIVLMDIELPGINGWEATQYIRTKYAAPVNAIPILALTAYAYDSERKKCIESGMNDVLIKPYKEDELYLKMRELLFNEKYIAPVQIKSNIEELEERYSNDLAALKELYDLFLLEMPVYIRELKELQTGENKVAITKQAHKMKSPVSLFGEMQTIEALRVLNAGQNLSKVEQDKLIDKVISDCRLLLVLIKKKSEKLG
jgi:signal transduction histidine kinase/CheY-like chemotaxis protein